MGNIDMLHGSIFNINETRREFHGISPGQVSRAFDVMRLPERVTPEIYLNR